MPDIFILGYTKCATTSLYNQLTQHPNVANVQPKEPHYHFAKVKGTRFEGHADADTVAQMFVTDPDHYRRLYNSPGICIDASAMSIDSPRVVEAINHEYPNAKHIIMLREPVERAFSAYSHLVRDVRETLSFNDALVDEAQGLRASHLPIWQNIQSSRYVEAVQHARTLLEERLLVINYHDYVNDNQNTVTKVARFIGLDDDDFVWQRQHSNRSGTPKSKILQKTIMRQSPVKTLFVKLFPQKLVKGLKRYLMEHNTGQKTRLTAADRHAFANYMATERAKINPDSPDRILLEAMYDGI